MRKQIVDAGGAANIVPPTAQPTNIVPPTTELTGSFGDGIVRTSGFQLFLD
jgi:hypothetical protein